jgi:hypothetical protein
MDAVDQSGGVGTVPNDFDFTTTSDRRVSTSESTMPLVVRGSDSIDSSTQKKVIGILPSESIRYNRDLIV